MSVLIYLAESKEFLFFSDQKTCQQWVRANCKSVEFTAGRYGQIWYVS